MGTTKPTERENIKYRYAFWMGPGGPTDKENQVKMYKKYRFWHISSWNSKELYMNQVR